MKLNQSNKKNATQLWIIILSILGLAVCIAVFFLPIRLIMKDFAERILNREILGYEGWFKTLLSYVMGGICVILFFDFCTLTDFGKMLVKKTKQEIKDCISEIDFRSLWKPVLFMSAIYLLGIFAILRANYLYADDLGRSVDGYRVWYNWSRYVNELLSIFIHADTKLTEISPLPQLLAIFLLSISSVLLVYILGEKKITYVRLLASIPLGLSPYFLECLSYKFDAPYMALSILSCIVPFLFITRKKAFIFCSFVSLLVMCMTYQAASGIYLLLVVILCFQYWNNREKSYKEILSLLGTAAFAFCFALLFFRFFLTRSEALNEYSFSTAIHPLPHMFSGILNNIKGYTTIIGQDFGIIWKIGIALVCIFFITKSVRTSARKKTASFFISMLVMILSFLLSYGFYYLLANPFFAPRALFGFGIFLSVICIYVVSNYKKIAVVTVLALNWCFFVFAFSYGNALADQARYEEFRIGILLHDLSTLNPNRSMFVLYENSIDFAPTIKNISKHYPIIERLVPKRLKGSMNYWDRAYLIHFNYNQNEEEASDFRASDLPVVLDSYYHTIKSDGTHCLVILKH